MKMLKYIFGALLALVLWVSCNRHEVEKPDSYDRVLIICLAGQNNLYNSMLKNVSELKTGYIPGEYDDKALVILSHGSDSYSSETGKSSPYLIQVYKNEEETVVLDTLMSFSPDSLLTHPSFMKSSLNRIRSLFPSKSYGFLFSSHATGWIPEEYYTKKRTQPKKSIGLEIGWEKGESKSVEMSLVDFADSFPFKMDYVLMDACLCGGVEVAYEMKDACDYIVFSPAEIMSKGFPYDKLVDDVFNYRLDYGLKLLCKDYFDRFDAEKGINHSATISLVETASLDNLAHVCKDLYEKYRDTLLTLDYTKVQPYYRNTVHWYFDLEDMLLKVGIDNSEQSDLADALSSAVIYKAATPSFMYEDDAYIYYDGFVINHYCGLSTYLQCAGSEVLDEAYKKLSWNKATSFVR